ncbi:hypothetical protein [Enterococcus caccae]|uniref:Uncharacterized protein n=1 Tax=Enterococcus caccae ATCC BAA-1240 TaxID=1158612 RepID=R3WCA4_9ENTE|nr:hypothetical protein [Enterococcus caccae]EOL45102.1 hypothetical protein UC7_01908 [Enterococcus caccae ATCC BAA-1240]EOT58509.1 hypothetical protein I580_02680 [Enterococcus caccae ATCC BAA-1240]OJG27164.1 hypothetical protein RU98_GL002944 [Enterococcus caccae]
MITNRFIQTKANFGKIYELREENRIIGTTKIPINLRMQINVSIANKNFKLQFSIIKNALSRFDYTKNVRLLPFQIFNENNVLVGSLCERRTKWLFGYTFFELSYNDETYYFYAIGLGKKGLKIPMYDSNDIQVGLIEKDNISYDNKSTYTINTLDKNYQMLAFFFSVYYDNAYYSPNEVAYKSKEINYKYTINKELKSKYNPQFIEGRY